MSAGRPVTSRKSRAMSGLCATTVLFLAAGQPHLEGLSPAILLSAVGVAVALATTVILVGRLIRRDTSGLPWPGSVSLALATESLWAGRRLTAADDFGGRLPPRLHRDIRRTSVGHGLYRHRTSAPPLGAHEDLARRPASSHAVVRALDLALATTAVLVLAVPLLLIALWVRLDTRGPALLRQERIGLGGRPFVLYKFRSMRVDSDDLLHRRLIEAELRGETTLYDGSTKVPDDPRITRSGAFLRRTSLDELPQLINILRGDMTLVGPRPCLPWEAAMFPAEFAARFSVRPGLTGLWQVSGRTTLGTLDMLRLDLAYVQNRSLSGDLSILLRTIPALLRPDGAR
ncbi:MAG: glycosyl transferase [Blastococcus sp.]|jgi:lipopolysaccharide/colanic/teichoic acid biosynthesis glycosyltransferase|nr:glycosyl transferase [Blastococcus sp.]